jgi:prepilin-type processing-associated H-X9-DG protein
MSVPCERCGFGRAELVVVVAIVVIVLLVVLAKLPRGREVARRVSCERNLGHIGAALALYDQSTRHLPTIPKLGADSNERGNGPLRSLLELLVLPDLLDVSDPKNAPPKRPGTVIREQPVPGFVCPSDPKVHSGSFPAPISYRANTGDTPDGRGGPFALGQRVGLADVEAGDGVGYTAAFSERLLGNLAPASALENYMLLSGSIPAQGCPAENSDWRGDAGASWFASDWRSTLYNHALVPNAAPSCMAADAAAAFMGTSSGHNGVVNVLMCDGSVKRYTFTVDPSVWRALSTVHSTARRSTP